MIGFGVNGLLQSVFASAHEAFSWRFRLAERSHGLRKMRWGRFNAALVVLVDSPCSFHGLIVAVLTGLPLLALAEWAWHGLIDDGKCRHRYSILTDQLLHLGYKAAWAALIVMVFPAEKPWLLHL